MCTRLHFLLCQQLVSQQDHHRADRKSQNKCLIALQGAWPWRASGCFHPAAPGASAALAEPDSSRLEHLGDGKQHPCERCAREPIGHPSERWEKWIPRCPVSEPSLGVRLAPCTPCRVICRMPGWLAAEDAEVWRDTSAAGLCQDCQPGQSGACVSGVRAGKGRPILRQRGSPGGGAWPGPEVTRGRGRPPAAAAPLAERGPGDGPCHPRIPLCRGRNTK